MALKHTIFGSILLGSMVALNSLAAIESRVDCKQASAYLPQTNNTVEDYRHFLDANRIVNVSGEQMDVHHLESFLFEYNKFPESLRQEMIENYSSIHIIAGNSVTEDPTWNPKQMTTFDNRNWSEVVGAGGFPYMEISEQVAYNNEMNYINKMRQYCSSRLVKCDRDWSKVRPQTIVSSYPTRIVVDKLYTDQTKVNRAHGSVNLFLHEHAHSLDSLYSANGVSNSKAWSVLSGKKSIRDYMKVVCLSPDYCLNNKNESFAELFAYYHACEGSRQHMERNAPDLAVYFKNLKRIKETPSSAKPKAMEQVIQEDQDCAEEDSILSKITIPKVKLPKLPFGL